MSGADEGFIREVGERGPTPERQRGVEAFGRRTGVALVEKRPPFIGEPCEALGVELIRRDSQHVSGWP